MGFVREAELCALAGEAKRDESRSNFRRRRESSARKFKDKFGARIELRENGEIAVVARARVRGEASRDFGLNDDMNFVDEIREREEVLEDRRGDEVRQISVNADAAAGGDGGEVGFENIAGNYIEIGMIVCEAAEAGDERWIEFDRVDGSAGGDEVLGHFAVS